MNFNVQSTDFFLNQIKGLDEKAKRIVKQKIGLIIENSFRFKRIHSKKFNKVFRVRLNIQGKETRLIYVVLEPRILLVCLLERKNEYRDLEHYLSKI